MVNLNKDKNKTMNKHFYWSALLGLGLLASCGKAEEPRPSVTPELETQPGTFELNLTAGVSDQAMRTLTFSGIEDLSEAPKISKTSDFTTHAFFRKKGLDQVGYATIKWTVREEGGRIKLILPKTNIALQNISDQTIDANEEWYVAGIAGGGVLNSAKTEVSFAPDLALAADKLRAPIAFPWTRIYKNKMINVTFNPKGVLVRAVVENYIGKDVPSIDLQITSNELDYNGKFDFSVAANPLTDIEQGAHEPVWKFASGNFGTAHTAKLDFRAKNFRKDTKQRIMVWAMSRELPTGQTLSLAPKTATTVELLRAGRPYPFTSKVAMKNTQSYSIEAELDVVSPALLLASKNVNKAGTGFATNDHADSGDFKWQQAIDLLGRNIPAFKGYHLPNTMELAMLINQESWYRGEQGGTEFEPSAWMQFTGGKKVDYSDPEEFTQIGSITGIFRGEYRSAGGPVAYGLRFLRYTTPPPSYFAKEVSNGRVDDVLTVPFPGYEPVNTNRWRTAFRYTYDAKAKILEIDMVRIGDAPEVTSIESIATPTWWNQQSQKSELQGRIYKITIALTGIWEDEKKIKKEDLAFQAWSSSGLFWTDLSAQNIYLRLKPQKPYDTNPVEELTFTKGHSWKGAYGNVRLVKDMDV